MNKPIQKLILDDKKVKDDSFVLGLLLALSIGVMNACTYLERGHVFASSQSGNLLYLGLDVARGEWSTWLKYLFPPLMYAAGIVIAEHFRDEPDLIHWKRYPFFLEIILVTVATFMPLSWNDLVNPLFGLACGLQTITFKHIREVPVATVFINGSFQNAVVHACKYIHLNNEEDIFRTLLYFGIVLAYLLGIIVGAVATQWMGQYVSLLSTGIFVICAIHMKKAGSSRL